MDDALTTLAQWLLVSAVHGLVLAAVALVVVPRLSTRPRVRAVLWRGALIAPLISAAVVVGAAHVEVSPRDVPLAPRTVSLSAAVRPHVPAAWRRVLVERFVDEYEGAPISEHTVFIDLLARTLGLIVLGTGVGGALVGLVRLRRRRARAVAALGPRRPIGATEVWGVGTAVTDGILRSVVLTQSASTVSPLTLGRREICLPAAFGDLPESERHSVLLHEIAHVVRRDPAWLRAADVLTAASWWIPLQHNLLRALRHETERAADAEAVARGASPEALVAALARFSRGWSRGIQPVGVTFARMDSPIVDRARLLLDRNSAAGTMATRAMIARGGAWALLALGIVLALQAPLPTVADASAMRRVGATHAPPPNARVVETLDLVQR